MDRMEPNEVSARSARNPDDDENRVKRIGTVRRPRRPWHEPVMLPLSAHKTLMNLDIVFDGLDFS